MIERDPIRFSKWTPVQRDHHIGYSYVLRLTYRNGAEGARRIQPGTDRWMRAKAHIAASAIASGVEEFRVWGGLGPRAWVRTVLVSQDEADEWFRGALAKPSGFMLEGAYRRACVRRDLRLAVCETANEGRGER